MPSPARALPVQACPRRYGALCSVVFLRDAKSTTVNALRKHVAWWLGGLVLLGGMFWFLRATTNGSDPAVRPKSRDLNDASLPSRASPSPLPPVAPRVPRRSPSVSTETSTQTVCQPYVSQECYAGNVHWFDDCGHVQDVVRECGSGLCQQGKCVETTWVERCSEPPEGRCDENRLVYCDLGATRSVDCARLGKVCAPSAYEGAACVDPTEVPRCEPGPPRCDGHVLHRCAAGMPLKTDCSRGGGRCSEPEPGEAFCVKPRSLQTARTECGACGCDEEPVEAEETCNGIDDDENGYVDDGIDCGAVKLDVWIGSGAYGERVLDPEHLEAELVRTNQVFADSAAALRFELGEVRDLPMSDTQSVNVRQLAELRPSLATKGPEFRLAVVFVDQIVEGEIPRLGLQFPSVADACGDIVRQGGRKREEVLVAVSQRRSSTTLAHEIGHALGLCHTHATAGQEEIPAAMADDESMQLCAEPCAYGGDAICDTPLDHEACTYDRQTCAALCPSELAMSGAGVAYAPDTSNVMSYYHSCRRRFTADQVKVMEHTLAARRGWSRCTDGQCSCEWGSRSCPFGMSCRPQTDGQTFTCGMDGPRHPGEACRRHDECSAHSLCLGDGNQSWCMRGCTESSEDCECAAQGPGGRFICRNDGPTG